MRVDVPQKLLIIDDSTTVRAMVRASLQDQDIEFAFADNGADGLTVARLWEPDLVLLDVEMLSLPDGFEVCRQLKADATTMRAHVIFLSGAATTAQKVRGLDLGAVDYITKPFDPAELSARVRASLRSKFMLDLLAKKAMIDGLTGLWNRAYLDHRISAELQLAHRHGRMLSLIMTDVDRFKSLNDKHGHPFGDEVLRRIARFLVEGCRTEDVVCRYGGEEFVILTPEVGAAKASLLAERLRCAIAQQRFRHRDADVCVSCSFGVAELEQLEHEHSASALIERADLALYQAKSSGRNRVVVVHRPQQCAGDRISA